VKIVVERFGATSEQAEALTEHVRESGAVSELREIIQERFGAPSLPAPGRTVAVAFDQPKTAALFFDYVWSVPSLGDHIPREYATYGAADFEIWTQTILLLGQKLGGWDKLEPLLRDTPVGRFWDRQQPAARSIAELLFEERGIQATPIYESRDLRRAEYEQGRYDVLIATFDQLGIVNESALTWEQVREFRKDSQARSRFRRLIHWADSEMVGRSASFIADEVAQKLEAYEGALRKHGIETLLGSIETILDPKFIAASSTVFAALALGSTLPVAAVGTATMFVAKTACSVVRGLLNIQDSKRGANGEVAVVYELQRRLR
jgi:hypothetical protein